MTSKAEPAHPPRIANWLVNLFAVGEAGESLLGDMLEEFSQLASKSGLAFATSWYWRQARKTIAHLVGNDFRMAPWLIAATVIGGLLLNRLVSGLPEPAIFAVLHRYQVFNHHFSAYMFFATDGIKMGHVIASIFVGCVVALAAKGREMVATTTLAFVLCAMTGTAMLVWVATGQPLLPWMLPWYVADWFAIVMGGAIVRMRRLTATKLPSTT
jgi:hypothetical protein